MKHEVFAPQEDSPIEAELIQRWTRIAQDANAVISDARKSEEERFAQVVFISAKVLHERFQLDTAKTMMSPYQAKRLEEQYSKLMKLVLDVFSKAPKDDSWSSIFDN